MKRLIFAILILALILSVGIAEHYHVHKVFDEMDYRLSKMENEIKSESDDALAVTHDLTDWWNNERKTLELFTFSPDIRAFSVALAEAEGSLECGDFANALSKCQSLMSMSSNMRQILDFNAEDVI